MICHHDGLRKSDNDHINGDMKRFLAVYVWFLLLVSPGFAAEPHILMLGDSLTAGYGVTPGEALPVKLEAGLRVEGIAVKIINAGVSGDTAAQGLARLDWALTDDVGAVIVALGGNDALRGLPPAQMKDSLQTILETLRNRKMPVLLLGMRAPPNLGVDYVAEFEAVYPALATDYGVALYPFFLEGVAAMPDLLQDDGLHPNGAGVQELVRRLLPSVKTLVAKVTTEP
jgi:acyl-CoA thioesterase I